MSHKEFKRLSQNVKYITLHTWNRSEMTGFILRGVSKQNLAKPGRVLCKGLFTPSVNASATVSASVDAQMGGVVLYDAIHTKL